jgi:hypothetical protein
LNITYNTKPAITNDKPTANVVLVVFLRKNGIIRHNSPDNNRAVPQFFSRAVRFSLFFIISSYYFFWIASGFAFVMTGFLRGFADKRPLLAHTNALAPLYSLK